MRFAVIGALGLLGACVGDPPPSGSENDGREATLTPIQVIDGEFGRIVDVAVSDEGTVFVADGQAMQIQVFSREGRALHTVGRRGSGPGELQAIADLDVRGDTLFVLDPRLGRVTLFPEASRPDRPDPMTLSPPPGSWRPRAGLVAVGDQSIAVISGDTDLVGSQASRTSDRLMFLGRGGAEPVLSDVEVLGRELLVTRDGSGGTVQTMPFGARTYLSRFADSLLLETDSRSSSVRFLDASGQEVGQIQLGLSGVRPVLQSDLDHYLASVSSGIETIDRIQRESIAVAFEEGVLPSQFPWFKGFAVSEGGEIWVQPILEADVAELGPLGNVLYRGPESTLMRFDSKGDRVETVEVDSNATLAAAWRGRLYLVSVDSLGVERVEVFE